jgi:hypothetical protein
MATNSYATSPLLLRLREQQEEEEEEEDHEGESEFAGSGQAGLSTTATTLAGLNSRLTAFHFCLYHVSFISFSYLLQF